LKDEATPVISSAISLVEQLIKTSKEFINRRILTDVWPILKRTLQETLKDSQIVHTSYYHFSNSFRLQKLAFNLLQVIIDNLSIEDVDLIEIIEFLIPFLNENLPLDTQTCNFFFFLFLFC